MHRQPVTGQEGMIGAVGTVKEALSPRGSIFVWGERWQAVSHDGQEIPAGTRVKIVALEGFLLTVKREER